MSNTITIRLTNNLEKNLNIVVQQDKISKSDIVRDALKRYLSVRRFRQLRNKTLPFAEAQGLLTDEDIFKALQ